MSLTEAGRSERVKAMMVPSNYFDVLGTRPPSDASFARMKSGRRQAPLHQREIAIRLAGGASSRDMQRMVIRQAARLALSGGAIGLPLAIGTGTLMRSLLVGVAPIDPVSIGVTTLLFAAVLTTACWRPARRAATTDPAVALRAE
jgi:hypothetical protein